MKVCIVGASGVVRGSGLEEGESHPVHVLVLLHVRLLLLLA